MFIINFDQLTESRLYITDAYTGKTTYIKKKNIKRIHEKYHILPGTDMISTYTYANKSEHILRTLILKHNKQFIINNLMCYITPDTPPIFIDEYINIIIDCITKYAEHTYSGNNTTALAVWIGYVSRYPNLDFNFWTKCLIRCQKTHTSPVVMLGLFTSLIKQHHLCNEIYKWGESVNYASINDYYNHDKFSIILNSNADIKLITKMLSECKFDKQYIEIQFNKHRYFIYSKVVSTLLHNLYGTSIYWDIGTFISNNDYENIIKYSNIFAESLYPNDSPAHISRRKYIIDRILVDTMNYLLSNVPHKYDIINKIFGALDTNQYNKIRNLMSEKYGELPNSAYKYLIQQSKQLLISAFKTNIGSQVYYTQRTNLTLEDFKVLNMDKFDLFTVFTRLDLNYLYTGFNDIEQWLSYQINYSFLRHRRITSNNLHQILNTILVNERKYRIGSIYNLTTDRESQRIINIMKNPNLRYSHLKKIIKFIDANPNRYRLIIPLESELSCLFENPKISNTNIIKFINHLYPT